MPTKLLKALREKCDRVRNLHTERLISLLQAVGSEVLQLVDILTEHKPRLLSYPESTSRDKGIALNVAKRCFGPTCVHHQFAIQRKTCNRHEQTR